mgnify:CR=1 FL=1
MALTLLVAQVGRQLALPAVLLRVLAPPVRRGLPVLVRLRPPSGFHQCGPASRPPRFQLAQNGHRHLHRRTNKLSTQSNCNALQAYQA